MNTPIFPNGITGLSDTEFSGSQGNAHRLVGVDFRSKPGVIKPHQKLKKISSTFAGEVETNVVTELCKNKVILDDKTKLWFSSESGKIWKQVNDTFTLVHTMAPATDFKEPNSIVDGVWDNDDIETGVSMSIAENNTVYGDLDSLTLTAIDGSRGVMNTTIELSEGNFITIYSGTDGDGFIKSYYFTNTGDYTETEVLEFDTSKCEYPSVCRIDDTHFILHYEGGASGHGFIKTFSGPFTFNNLSTLEHDITTTGDGYGSLIQIDTTHYALAYAGGADNYGMIKIFTIDGAYAVTQTSSLTHDNTGKTKGHKLVKVDATHMLLTYTIGTTLIAKTFAIDEAWNVTQVDSETLQGNASLEEKDLLQLDSTHYLLGSRISGRGILRVLTLDGSYNITQTYENDFGPSRGIAAMFKTDEYHVLVQNSNIISSIFVFEFDNSYDNFRQVCQHDYTNVVNDYGSYANFFREGRNIGFVYSLNNLNYVNLLTMTETYSNGIILKPSGTDPIKLIASKFYSQRSMATQFLTTTIKIPEGYNNLDIVVIAGRCGSETYAPVGITVAGNAMTQICNRNTTYGFKCSSAFFNKVNPAVGDNEIIVDFGSATSYVYMAVLVFKNVHQTTPYSATVDYGWQDYLELPGSSKNELRIGSFLTKINPHYSGELQDQIGNMDISEDNEFYTISISSRNYAIGTAKILGASNFSYIQSEQLATDEEDYKPEEQIEQVYYCNENVLFAVPVDKIDYWSTNIKTVGEFKNGDDTYHSMVQQNLELFIGDNTVISKVNSNGDFIPETLFNVAKPERIQVLGKFDTDVLVGTKIINSARVLRWDTFSDSWYADDDVMETGINAFIRDDNYTYVSAGDYGRIYFYNGEKLRTTKRIPGVWDSTHKAIVNENAVEYYMGNPIFGLSNSTGNPALQGIYGFGNYDEKYEKAMSLDYPLPTNEFSGVNIGALLVDGSDMFVSYKTATDVGIAKIDHSNKYNNAYIETMMLSSKYERDQRSIIEGICADYISLPTGTSVSIGIKTKYDTNYTDMATLVNDNEMTIKTKTIPKVNNLQVKFTLVSSANDGPEIENFGIL